MIKCACWYRERLDKILCGLENQATDWAYQKLADTPMPTNFITPESERTAVLYYKKHAGKKIVEEICKAIREAFDETET